LPGSEDLRAEFAEEIQRYESGNSLCLAKECKKPSKSYERILEVQPGVQWMDHGGYCGSWSIQRVAMAKGAYLSQQQVRDHASPGGGNDNEILATNIDAALKKLKLKAEGFDYEDLQKNPKPQKDNYRSWIKQKLSKGHGVVWMIMQPGERYPVYPSLPKNTSQYGHIEPVVGILSDKPLDDPQFYDDDYIVHFTDANGNPYYRSMESLPDGTDYSGNCRSSHYVGFPCIYDQLGFGWSVEGFLNDAHAADALPVSLSVSPNNEPDVRTGSQPKATTATLKIEGLTAGKSYAVYRWDSVDAAFDYSNPGSVHRFTASSETETYADSKTFLSSAAIYYRCIEYASVVV